MPIIRAPKTPADILGSVWDLCKESQDLSHKTQRQLHQDELDTDFLIKAIQELAMCLDYAL